MAAAIATTNPSKSTVGGGARCSREMEREVASSPLRSAVAQPTSQPALASARLVASAPRLFQPVATISTRIQSPRLPWAAGSTQQPALLGHPAAQLSLDQRLRQHTRRQEPALLGERH